MTGTQDRLHYDYTASKAYAVSIGMVWLPGWVPNADQHFFDAGLTQSQVDAVMRLYAWNVKHLFTPSSYPWRSRVAMAFRWLIG